MQLTSCAPLNSFFSQCSFNSSVFDLNIQSGVFKYIPSNTNVTLVVNGKFENVFDSIQWEFGSSSFILEGVNPEVSVNFSELIQNENQTLKSFAPSNSVNLPVGAIAEISKISLKFNDAQIKSEIERIKNELSSAELTRAALSLSRSVLNSFGKMGEAFAAYQTNVSKLRNVVLNIKKLSKEMVFLNLVATGEIKSIQTLTGKRNLTDEESNAVLKFLSLVQSSSAQTELNACNLEQSIRCEKKIFEKYFSKEDEKIFSKLTQNLSLNEMELIERELLKMEQNELQLNELLLGTCSFLPIEWKEQFLGEAQLCNMH
jgi:hypothetical protein